MGVRGRIVPSHGRSDAGVGNSTTFVQSLTVSPTLGTAAVSGTDPTISEGSSTLSEVAVPADTDWSAETAIIQPGSAGSWDVRLAGASPGSITKMGGTYYLYYIGADGDRSSDGGPAHRAVGLATCSTSDDPTDPANWTKHASNPVIPWSGINENGDEEEGAWGVAAYVDGTDLILYVTHLEGGGGGVAGPIYLWESTDGVNFTVANADAPVIDNTDTSFPGEDEINPVGVYVESDGTWHLFYIAKGNDLSGNWVLCKAVGTGRAAWTSGQEVHVDNAHRYGGDVSIMQDDGGGVKLGIMMGRADTDNPFYELSDSDTFATAQTETFFSWNSWEAVVMLERSNNRWLGLHGNSQTGISEEDVDAIDIRTAPMTLV